MHARFSTRFRDRVLAVVKKIRRGKTLSYKEVAVRAGHPGAARAVGSIMAANRDKSVPCHRVIRSDLPAPRPETYFVYAILCDNNAIYIGQTQDIQKRWQEHRDGIAADYTRRYGVKKIIHYETFRSREKVVEREKWLKTGFGRKWLRREWKVGRTRQAGGTLGGYNSLQGTKSKLALLKREGAL